MKYNFYDINIDVISKREVINQINDRFVKDINTIVLFLNAHCYNIAMINLKYRNALSKASFLLNDGIGVELAGRLSGVIFKDNLNGTDLIPEVLKKMPDGCKIFLLGAKEGVAKNAFTISK